VQQTPSETNQQEGIGEEVSKKLSKDGNALLPSELVSEIVDRVSEKAHEMGLDQKLVAGNHHPDEGGKDKTVEEQMKNCKLDPDNPHPTSRKSFSPFF